MTSAAFDIWQTLTGSFGRDTFRTNDGEFEGTILAVLRAVSRGRWRDNEDVRHPWERASRPAENIQTAMSLLFHSGFC